MQKMSNRAMRLIGMSLAGLAMIGCKDSEPSDYQQNMGVEGAPLLAVGNPRTVVAVAAGQAEWVEFRSPNVVAKETTPTNNGDAVDTGEIEQEINDFVADYNEVVIDRDIDGTLDFFVDAQREALRPVIQSMFDIANRLTKVHKTISTQLPDSKDRTALAFSKLGPASQARLEVKSINVVGDGQVNGTLPPGSISKSCRFILEDDAWYIQYDVDTLSVQSTAILGVLEKLLTSIEGSKSSADDLLATIEDASAAEGG